MRSLSIVIPVFNEEKNLAILYREILRIDDKLHSLLEIIFINDGSFDNSLNLLKDLHKNDSRVKIIEFSNNFGQTASFDAGIKNSTGSLIVTIDSDLQNDPADIPRLIDKLNEGYDVVCGWRVNRKDPYDKKILSYIANCFRRSLTGESIHDSGCSLRVYKREVFDGVDLYGEMHRFIPAILALKGYRIAELKVNHRDRKYGKSKYGIKRIIKGLFDLVFIVFLLRFSARPLHIFGTIGLITFISGFAMAIYLTLLKIAYAATLSNRPLLILSVLLMVLGAQFFIFGILAEILIRIYFKTHAITPYTIREKYQ